MTLLHNNAPADDANIEEPAIQLTILNGSQMQTNCSKQLQLTKSPQAAWGAFSVQGT